MLFHKSSGKLIDRVLVYSTRKNGQSTSREVSSITTMGDLLQSLTTLILNNFFLRSSIKLPSLSLKPLEMKIPLEISPPVCHVAVPLPDDNVLRLCLR